MKDFSVAAVFSNHMVLQRNKIINIFGYGEEDTFISVSLYNSKNQLLSKNSTSVTNGRWEVQLEEQKEQENCSLKVNDITFTDIAIGEVWLAGGQSNMEFELQNCVEGPAAMADKKDPKVRFYYTNKIAWKDESYYEAERNTSWQTWDSEWKKAWSAVGFFFAKKLAKDTGCIVGVIGCNWGGTSASAWMRKEYLEKDDDLRTYLTEQEEATKGKSIEEQCKEYEDYEKENDVWQKECAKLYETQPGITWALVEEKLGKCKWPGPKSCKNPYRPCGLYDCMLSRIIPYTIKGVIWYQGESDDHKPAMYAKLFSTMIDNWRTDWKDNLLPFIFVQLPCHRYEQDKDFKHWCFIREAQAKVHSTVKNTWMTVALDLGKYNDIHPTQKEELGYRMENTALACVYQTKKEEDCLAPQLESAIFIGDRVKLSFLNAKDGFVYKEDKKEKDELIKLEKIQGNDLPEDFTAFEVAGEDKVYYPATFSFGTKAEGLNTITLYSKNVALPKYARYAWYNYGPVTIYGKNNLPLAPFRTDEYDSFTSTDHAAIQQVMTVNS